MHKITRKDKNFFLKWLPFNFCDRFCERCETMRNDCKLYHSEVEFKMWCLREGKIPDDPEVAFERISKILAETVAAIKQNFRKEGFELSEIDEDEYKKEIRTRNKRMRCHPLYRRCNAFSVKVNKLFSDFSPAIPPEIWAINFFEKEMKEIYFYGPMVLTKTAHALFSCEKNQDIFLEFDQPDYLVSAALGYCSLLTVENSLKNIREFILTSEPIWVLRINELIENAEKIKLIFEKKFPEVKYLKNKIIFHGNY